MPVDEDILVLVSHSSQWQDCKTSVPCRVKCVQPDNTQRYQLKPLPTSPNSDIYHGDNIDTEMLFRKPVFDYYLLRQVLEESQT